MSDFYKYHGLGNDYLVINPSKCRFIMTPENIRLICSRHYGIGADGILFGPISEALGSKIKKLKIYNADGSEAEKSGNGLRIFAWFLYEYDYTDNTELLISTNNEVISIKIIDTINRLVKINIGKPNFDTSIAVPSVNSNPIINEEFIFGGTKCRITFVSFGNPHCVLYGQKVNESLTRRLGPLIEKSSIFPEKVNVQFCELISPSKIKIQIWERGVGYTMSSGTSSCAAAAVAYRMGLVGKNVTVYMPGGKLNVTLSCDGTELIGPIDKVMEGNFSQALMDKLIS